MTEAPEPLKPCRSRRERIADRLVYSAVTLVGFWVLSIFGLWSLTFHVGQTSFGLGIGEGRLLFDRTFPAWGSFYVRGHWTGGPDHVEDAYGRFHFRHFDGTGGLVPGFSRTEIRIPIPVAAIAAGCMAYLIRRRFRITLVACLMAAAVVAALFTVYGRLIAPD